MAGRYALPFFDPLHRQLAHDLAAWCEENNLADEPEDVDARCRALVAALGKGGWLRYCVPASAGGMLPRIDSRALCILRETLAYHAGLADFAFAMQGLGSGAITLAGTPAQQERYLPNVAAGRSIAAFALSEPEAGSDAAALTTTATRDSADYRLNGAKTWISNGGIADFYTVFARSEDAPGPKGISAFIVPADAPGLHIAERIPVIAPHPLATLQFDGCRVPASNMLGAPGSGFKLAMQTLDIFRTSVAAAALGFARRALDEALRYVQQRQMFGRTLADMQMTQAKLATMATEVEASALLTYQAAWLRDVQEVPATREVAMAKMTATESAQRVIDAAVQLFGGLGVRTGQVPERLYREVRALRIYEGATEVQQLIIARSLLKEGTR
ncbi:MAG: acyl-CoA dehydrogenase family protein [Ktedonobacteraceae bacterium]